MASVIERHGYAVHDGGAISYDESPSTFEAAEKLAGKRLDRRRNYAIVDGQVCESASWSQACSGCYEGCNSGSGRGSGCHECGYSGRVRCWMWVPIVIQESSEDL